MLVVLAIIVVVSAIAIGGQQNFDRTVSLNNTAYAIALSLREAQTYGLTSLRQTSASTQTYGVNFDASALTAYTLYTDSCPLASANKKPDQPGGKAGNGYYDVTLLSGCTASEKVREYTLNNGFRIEKFCAQSTNGSNPWICSNTTTVPLALMDVSFTRPEAEARIYAKRNAYSGNYLAACVTVSGPTGETRTVSVSSSGQISVTNSTCGS